MGNCLYHQLHSLLQGLPSQIIKAVNSLFLHQEVMPGLCVVVGNTLFQWPWIHYENSCLYEFPFDLWGCFQTVSPQSTVYDSWTVPLNHWAVFSSLRSCCSYGVFEGKTCIFQASHAPGTEPGALCSLGVSGGRMQGGQMKNRREMNILPLTSS